MEDYKISKIVHFNLFQPDKALFKSNRNDKAEVQLISCHNSENCGLFKRGECSFRALLSFASRCPYGGYHRCIGFTRKARKYHEWIKEQKKKYEGIGYLNDPVKKMAIVGEYIFLPYSYMDLYKDLEWYGPFIKKEDFTMELILGLINFRPQAMFGGEIKDYQKNVPPLFLKHLSELMPDLFEQLIKSDGNIKERFKEFSNIGRKAILETITPCVGELKDIHGGSWIWDGKQLHSTNSHMAFGLVNKFKKVSLLPEEKQIVKITDENQVNESTIFIN